MTKQQSRGGGRRGGWQQAELPDASDAPAWFVGRLPDDWFDGAPEVVADRDEITVVGTLVAPDADGDGTAAAEGRASRFREDTRAQRMTIADEAQARYGRTVSWGVRIGDERIMFTTPRRSRDDAPSSARAAGPRHPRRRGGRALACRRGGLVCEAGRRTHRAWLAELRQAMDFRRRSQGSRSADLSAPTALAWYHCPVAQNGVGVTSASRTHRSTNTSDR